MTLNLAMHFHICVKMGSKSGAKLSCDPPLKNPNMERKTSYQILVSNKQVLSICLTHKSHYFSYLVFILDFCMVEVDVWDYEVVICTIQLLPYKRKSSKLRRCESREATLLTNKLKQKNSDPFLESTKFK